MEASIIIIIMLIILFGFMKGWIYIGTDKAMYDKAYIAIKLRK